MRGLAWAVLVAAFGVPVALYATTPAAPAVQDMAVLQTLVDQAQPGQTVLVPPGTYQGHLTVTKPIILDGGNLATLSAGGKGTVLVVRTDGATIKNLHLAHTGSDHNDEDAGIQIRGSRNIVKDNRIDDALFGIDLQQSHFNIIRRNRISSKPIDLGMRGDGIRLWYSDDNKLEDNHLIDGRDFVLWYSKRNWVTGTLSENGRYGLHFMFSMDNVIENNRFRNNSAGISMMYDQGDTIRNNVISTSTGSTGTCISMKEASAVVIENNDVLYCATGLFFDVSPFQPDTVNVIKNNRIRFNDTAVAFLNDWQGNEFTGNTFKDNMSDVAVMGGGSAKRNVWDGNSWDDYQGFDLNKDGVGDSPHLLHAYSGRVWMDIPNTRFFKGTAVLEVLDFLDRLAPFSQPELLLEDANPRMIARKGQSS